MLPAFLTINPSHIETAVFGWGEEGGVYIRLINGKEYIIPRYADQNGWESNIISFTKYDTHRKMATIIRLENWADIDDIIRQLEELTGVNAAEL